MEYSMDWGLVFTSLKAVCEENITALSGPHDLPQSDASRRLVTCMSKIRDHGEALEPLVSCLTAVYHHYDFDSDTPGNGYRTLVKVLHSCLQHIIEHNRDASEMEAYCSALCQLRALLYLAQRLLSDKDYGQLYSLQDEERNEQFVREYTSMHKACFYGRCLGFQFSPTLGHILQKIVISMVSYGKAFDKRMKSGLGMAAFSLLTSVKYVINPELRGAEFERITQNLDMKFWKTFWNFTESELLSGLASLASNTVEVNLVLTVPPEPLLLPLASDPKLLTPVSPPVAHWGPGPVHMRLISYELREGQDSEELMVFTRTNAPQISFGSQKRPPSPWLLVHFHGGGFVAQTSKSHENYLKSWSKDLNVPILSVDYSLAPEAPFPRALEECFYAYCWALKNCHLLGSTAERVCLAGDSAGGNLCITVSMKAMACGVRVPDGIMAAYPATLLTTDISPSRMLTLIDPLLPLGVLSKCLYAYADVDAKTVESTEETNKQNDIESMEVSKVLHSLSDQRSLNNEVDQNVPSSLSPDFSGYKGYPEGFKPLYSEYRTEIQMHSHPNVKNPFVSPLLAPEDLLRGLPPVHLVASALDALLDDSVMFAKKLRDMGQPVTLRVVEDLPHGFLNLYGCSDETIVASNICVERIRAVFQLQSPPSSTGK
ncbi:hypothetical protein DPEC_G00203480 [Dallia pectoralis]|uniref:Uncharacterized protein n=1 Tax=Dallia pectoralis TaxID=75939 RepID=A0ACC2G9P7_DALPE|nr:hypothetical protein DPEC_G00203480 [Dallia pectoralis]